jgi:hypothetical protein
MWFFSTRLRRWLFMTVAVPLLGKAAHKLGDTVEHRQGPSKLSKGLHRAGNLAGRKANPEQQSPGQVRKSAPRSTQKAA